MNASTVELGTGLSGTEIETDRKCNLFFGVVVAAKPSHSTEIEDGEGGTG